MPEKLSVRVDRLETLMGLLAEAQIKTEERFQETEERFQEIGQRFRETDQRIDKLAIEAAERGRALDARIEKLVSAIGEMLRRNGKQ